ncbi:MAG: hypothetical protein ACTHJ4_07430 [Candidatus Nucleicultricaceae bacterium]
MKQYFLFFFILITHTTAHLDASLGNSSRSILEEDTAHLPLKKRFTQKLKQQSITLPKYEEIMQNAVLVHTGVVLFENNMPHVFARDGMTYWTMNAPVPNIAFADNAGRAASLIVTSLRKHVQSVISLCAQEVIYLGSTPLTQGDAVILFKRSIIEGLESDQNGHLSMRLGNGNLKKPTLQRHPRHVLKFFEDGYRLYYLRAEIEKLKRLGITVVELDTEHKEPKKDLDYKALKTALDHYLTEHALWRFGFKANFWTHKTPFNLKNNRINNQSAFFAPFFKEHPLISFGYAFHSVRGVASLFRNLLTCLAPSEEPELPDYVLNTLARYQQKSLKRYFKDSPLLPKVRQFFQFLHTMQDHEESEEADTDESFDNLTVIDTDHNNIDSYNTALLSIFLSLSRDVFDDLVGFISSIPVKNAPLETDEHVAETDDQKTARLLQPLIPLHQAAYHFVHCYRHGQGEPFLALRKLLLKNFTYDSLRVIYSEAIGYNVVNHPDRNAFYAEAAQALLSQKIPITRKNHISILEAFEVEDFEKIKTWFLNPPALALNRHLPHLTP